MLAYHRIVADYDEASYPLDLGLVSATPEEFEWQMRMLRERTTPISLTEVARRLAAGEPLPPGAAAVTFDDGFCDTHTTAFPILRRYQIPATVFVTTSYAESGEPFWFETSAHLMLRIQPGAVSVGSSPALPLGNSIADRRASIKLIHQALKTCGNPERSRLLHGWQAAHAATTDPTAYQLSRPISWAEIREMSAAGIEFGSHTVTHPNLALASDEQLEFELRQSKATIEDKLQQQVVALAYPFGTPMTYSRRVMDCARSAGYEMAASYRQGVNWLEAIEPFELQRLGMSPGVSPEEFAAMLALPEWLKPRLADDF